MERAGQPRPGLHRGYVVAGIDHKTLGARVRERDAIESIRAAGSRIG
jgi:hypothetical protein